MSEIITVARTNLESGKILGYSSYTTEKLVFAIYILVASNPDTRLSI